MANETPKMGVPPKPAEASTTTLKEIQQKLEHVERTTGSSGAIPNTPKQMLLDASDVQAKHPDKRLRWCSTANNEKMLRRKAEGYEIVPVSEGGKTVGNMVLMGLSREEFERRVRRIEARNKELLDAHNHEVEQVADGVARVLRDKYGLKVNPNDIIVRG